MYDHGSGLPARVSRSSAATAAPAPGKHTLTQAIQYRSAGAPSAHVPAPSSVPAAPSVPAIEATAARGVDTPTSALPHRDRIAASFGYHTINGIQAHTGSAAAAAARDMGALAFATGTHVVLGDTSLRTVAHEAAHVIQQRAGVHPRMGDDDHGDRWERHADAVADAVVRGESAVALLDDVVRPSSTVAGCAAAAPVQRMKIDGHDTAEPEAFRLWITTLEFQGKREQLQNMFQQLQVGTEPHEARARSMVQRALDTLAAPPPNRGNDEPPGLQHLPRDQWWKLFIDGNTHTGEDPVDSMRFDSQKSPGYYATMSRAFERFVSGSTKQPIDFDEYARMHEAVTQGTLSYHELSGHSGYLPVPHKHSGEGVMFPMTQGEYPNPVALQEMFEEDTLRLDNGQRPKMVAESQMLHNEEQQRLLAELKPELHKQVGNTGQGKLRQMLGTVYQMQGEGPHTHSSYVTLGQGNQLGVTTDMTEDKVPARVNQLFHEYYQTIEKLNHLAPETKRAGQLRAIARLVRALHVGHFYEDANGRLNTMLLLDRLLIDLGMSPIILPCTDIFGGAYSIDELGRAIEEGLREFERQLVVLASRYKDSGNDDIDSLFPNMPGESKESKEDDLDSLFPAYPEKTKRAKGTKRTAKTTI